MKWPIERGVTAALVVAVVVVGASGIEAYRNAAAFVHTNRIVNHTHEVLAALSKTLRIARDAQSGLRGYILTADENFLDPLFRAREMSAASLDQLGTLVSDNPAQTHRAVEFRALTGKRTDFENDVLRTLRTEGFEPARNMIISGKGKVLFDQMVKVASEMEEEERRLLRERTDLSEVTEQKLQRTFIVLAALTGLTLAGATLLIWRDGNRRQEAEAALKFSERRLNDIVANTPWIVRVKDRAGRYTLLNEPLAQLLGRRQDEILGKSEAELFPDTDAARYDHADETALNASGPVSGLETAPSATGTRTFLVTRFALRDETGSPNAVCAMAIDITEQKALEANLKRYAAEIADLYNDAPCGYHSLDADGTIVLINDTELSWLGYSREEIVGKKRFRELLTPESAGIFESNYPAFKASGHIGGLEFELSRKDGSTFWVLLSASAVRNPDGSYQMSRSVLHDITDRKLRDLQIDELHRRLEQKAASLEAANKELEAFSYSVSHDLRAPLRSVDGFSQALLEDCGDKLDGTSRDYLSRIRSGVIRMSQLIDDLLDLARVSRTELNVQPVNLTQMAREVASHLARAHPGRNVEIVVQEGLTVSSDPRLLRIVLENLLGNSWKFTARRESARIELGREYLPDGTPYLFVKDNGAGFDMRYSSKLFGIFQRLHSTQEFDGTGIGLVTIRRIIVRHGGNVWAEGAVDHGAKFSFTLPEPAAGAARQAAGTAETGNTAIS